MLFGLSLCAASCPCLASMAEIFSSRCKCMWRGDAKGFDFLQHVHTPRPDAARDAATSFSLSSLKTTRYFVAQDLRRVASVTNFRGLVVPPGRLSSETFFGPMPDQSLIRRFPAPSRTSRTPLCPAARAPVLATSAGLISLIRQS